MICRVCQTWNEDDEHRCTRCGRRLSLSGSRTAEGYPIASSPLPAYDYGEGAPSLLPQAEAQVELLPPRQPSLFPLRGPRKVIPFESGSAGLLPSLPGGRGGAPRMGGWRRNNQNQRELDFPTPQMRRSLETSMEAAIACDAKTAPASERVMAGIIDLAYVGVALIFLSVPYIMVRTAGYQGRLPEGKDLVLLAAGSALLVALLYHLFWAIGDADTPGMNARRLRLLNFDGHPPDVEQRLWRLAGGILGLASAGLGLLWTLVDEEGLAWHDHISKTFPTAW